MAYEYNGVEIPQDDVAKILDLVVKGIEDKNLINELQIN